MTVKRVCPYPVGSIHLAVDSTDPATIWPGTSWERIQDTMLMAAGTAYAAGTSGGAASHALTTGELPAHKHTVPAHGHAHTIKATTPQFTHSITQPVFKYTAPAAHSHGLGAGYAAITSAAASGLFMKTKRSISWTASYQNKFTSTYANQISISQTDGASLGGTTDSAACSGTANGTEASRTTNVAVGAHAATACTMSGGVTDKAAFDTESSGGGVGVLHAPAVPVGLRLEEGRVGPSAETPPSTARGWRDAA